MENQVLSIEQMQELQKLGIDTSKASMFWHPAFYRINGILDYDGYEDIPRIKLENNYDLAHDIPTFTLYDMLQYIHKYTLTKVTDGMFNLHSYINGCIEHKVQGKTEIETAFKMLKWYKLNQYV